MGYTYGMNNLGSNAADAYSNLSLLTGADEDNELARRASDE